MSGVGAPATRPRTPRLEATTPPPPPHVRGWAPGYTAPNHGRRLTCRAGPSPKPSNQQSGPNEAPSTNMKVRRARRFWCTKFCCSS
eukprot:gene19871-biopygen16080